MSKAAPNRLAGIIATKGEAPRPQDQPQRAAQSVPEPSPAPQAGPTRPAPTMGGVKSLTLRLPGEDYDRLRQFAFDNRTTHQDVLAAALREYLDARA